MSKYSDIACEQELIGAVLLNNAAFGLVEEIIQADHFFEPLHRDIWAIIGQLVGAGKLASPVTMRTFLPDDLMVDDLNARQYLARLAASATTIINAPDFARTLRDLADRRLIVEVGLELAQSKERDNLTLSSWAVDYLDGIVAAQSMSDAPAVNMEKAVARALDAAATAYQRDGKPRGVSYGLRDLDAKTLGASPGQLIVIAGRPGMGKTALAVEILRNMGEAGEPCLFVSLEMGDVELVTRMMSAKIWSPGHALSYWQISSGKYRAERFDDVRDAAMALRELPIEIQQQPGLTLAQIGARARQFKRKKGLKALFVDHLGLVKPTGLYAGNKVNETGEITTGLKGLAKELGVPVFLLCQINRGVEQREDKRPGLADLRNSGDIEQDADTVMILYREAYYLGKKEPHPASAEFIIWSDKMEQIQNRLEIGIEKQRSGPVCTVRLFCDIASNVIRDEVSEMDDSAPMSDRERADFK